MRKYRMTVMIEADVNLARAESGFMAGSISSKQIKQIEAMADAALMGKVERLLQELKAVCVSCERLEEK
jgi:hypothetical protein